MPVTRSRSPKNFQFAHAAAAMSAFWERARKREARRLELLHRRLIESAPALTGAAPLLSAHAAPRR